MCDHLVRETVCEISILVRVAAQGGKWEDGNFDLLRRARLRPAGRRGKQAAGKPGFELGTISVNRAKLVMLVAVNGQPLLFLPTLYCTNIAAQKAGDLLPGVKPVG